MNELCGVLFTSLGLSEEHNRHGQTRQRLLNPANVTYGVKPLHVVVTDSG